MIKRRVFWLGAQGSVNIADPYDCQYVNFPAEKMVELAGQLASQGIIQLNGNQAIATDSLRKEESAIRAAMQKAVEAGVSATKVSA